MRPATLEKDTRQRAMQLAMKGTESANAGLGVDFSNKLPGELRNKIYAFAIEPGYELDGSDHCELNESCHCEGILLSYRPPFILGDQRGQSQRYHSKPRCFFGLTQVNRTIRAEYRSLWLRDACVSIRLSELEGYLETFFPAARPNTEVEKYAGSIQAFLPGGMDDYVDMLPIVNLCHRAPSLKLEYTYKSSTFASTWHTLPPRMSHRASTEIVNDLNTHFTKATQSESTLQTYIYPPTTLVAHHPQPRISKILIRLPRHQDPILRINITSMEGIRPEIWIFFKRQDMRSWMDEARLTREYDDATDKLVLAADSPLASDQEEATAFLAKTGLVELADWHIYVDVE